MQIILFKNLKKLYEFKVLAEREIEINLPRINVTTATVKII